MITIPSSPSPIHRIVGHMDDTARSRERVAFAASLAREHGSELSVLYAAMPGYALVPYAPEGVGPAIELLREVDDDRLRKARQLFDKACSEAAVPVSFAPCCDVPVEAGFVQQALYSDLMVLGQREPRDPQSVFVPGDFAPYAIAASGRPAIVVPYTGALPQRLATVVIAWKEARESARAVSAALPFLQRARRVIALTWAEDEESAKPALVRIGQFLRAHGVEAETLYQGTEVPEIGELLLSRCAEFGADLLVMGCYGHSRTREWVMGGASRTILQSMTLPVLMSH